MHKTLSYSLICLNLIVFISAAIGDVFDETVAEIQDLEASLESTRTSIDQELVALRENHPLNAPKDTFESDADYQNRLSELDAIVAEHRTASLSQTADIQSEISLLYRRVFLTDDIIGTLGTYDANNEFFPITFETADRRIQTTLRIGKADAKALHDNWGTVRVTGWISIDPGYRQGLAQVKIAYPSLWEKGVTWDLDEVYSLGNNKLAVAFSPDGRYLATGDNDWQAIIWKLSTGQSIWQMKHRGDVWAVAFSPDGKYLATGNGNHGWANTGNRAAIWEVRNGKLYQQMAAGEVVKATAFSPDGRYLAIARQSGGSRWGDALIWDISNATTVQQVENLGVKAVAFSPDGKYFATGNIDGEVFIWKVGSGQPLQQMEHRRAVNAITFSRDGKYITTGSTEGKVSIWEVSSGQRLRQADHRRELYAVAYSPDGKYLAVGGEDQAITLYRIGTEEITLETEITKEKSIHTGREVRDLAWSPYGNLISDGNSVYRTLLNPEVHELETEAAPIQTPVPVTLPTSNATISLSPATVASPNIEKQITFSLNITEGTNVSGYQATVQFDTTALKYIESSNSTYLPVGAPAIPTTVEGNRVTLAATSLTGESSGNGTLATVTFEVIAVKTSTVTLSDVLLTDSSGGSSTPQTENAEITEPTQLPEDVNGDGVVDIFDLTLVASNFGETGANAADVNGDDIVNIIDLTLVTAAFGNTAAAPFVWSRNSETDLTRSDVAAWLKQARQLNLTDPVFQRGIQVLEQLLATRTPKETTLLPNYPNPFNPETWIPYQLATPADVSIAIYSADGKLVRTLALGHQPIGIYESRSRAAYWDGKNALGESVASGVYFYTLTAGDFTATRKMLIRK